jgi:hypothetical protein
MNLLGVAFGGTMGDTETSPLSMKFDAMNLELYSNCKQNET